MTGESAMSVSAVSLARALGRPIPTAEQVAVIEAPPVPLLVIAGAGSGKTETMASRVVWSVVSGGVAPEEVLGLTFTRKAAGELAERIRGRLRAAQRAGVWHPPDGSATVTVSTYHAFAGRLVREHGLRLGIEPEARLLTEAACWQLATSVVERWPGDMDAVTSAPSTVTQAVLTLAAAVAEHLVDLSDLDDYLAELLATVEALPYKESESDHPRGIGSTSRRYAAVTALLGQWAARRQIIPIVREYQHRKRGQHALDFGDQVVLAARLGQEAPPVVESERQQFRSVLLDEFQDTSHAQVVMLRRLFGAGHSVTAVGDPHQAIYGWRGAGSDVLSAFVRDFVSPDGALPLLRHLSTSWRNDRAILDAANRVAAPLGVDTAIEVRPLATRSGAGPGVVRVAVQPSAEQEADAVVEWLAEHWLNNGVPIPGCSAAVLCRRRAQFPEIEAALLRRGLPYQVVGVGGLLSTPEVADVLAALHVVADPTRGDLLMRLLTGPGCRLGPHDLTVLGAWARHLDKDRIRVTPDSTWAECSAVGLVEAIDDLPPTDWQDAQGRALSAPARSRLSRWADLLRDVRGRTALPLPELIADVAQALALDVELASRPGASWAQARAHLDAIIEVAARFHASAEYATLPAFLSWLQAADEQERGLEPGQVEVDEQVIQVLTIHAAKGLEWDLVAVPGMVEGGFPHHKSRASGDAGVSPEVTTRGWLADLGALPPALRGDAAALPDIHWKAPHQQSLLGRVAGFERAAGEQLIAEERRLAYVAWTRARTHLMITGHVWGEQKTPRIPSRFLIEVADAELVTAADPAFVEKPPSTTRTAVWPDDPLGDRRSVVEAAAHQVRRFLSAPREDEAFFGVGNAGELTGVDDAVVDVLLTQWVESRSGVGTVEVSLPHHMSASRLVNWQQDPRSAALAVRRPMPRPPAPLARRGTAFHAWVEQYFGGAAFVDIHELPGAADDSSPGVLGLTELTQQFLASPWASRQAIAVEVPLETPIDAMMVRGRVDAVFARPDGGVDIVDWKTGPPPSDSAASASARAIQLAVYRLAWHRLHGVPLDHIGAAFVYVAHGVTERPVDLLGDADLSALVRGLSS
ncbi:MAG: UvrD-helicase domain-containing protein [Actinomycetota bacterium]